MFKKIMILSTIIVCSYLPSANAQSKCHNIFSKNNKLQISQASADGYLNGITEKESIKNSFRDRKATVRVTPDKMTKVTVQSEEDVIAKHMNGSKVYLLDENFLDFSIKFKKSKSNDISEKESFILPLDELIRGKRTIRPVNVSIEIVDSNPNNRYIELTTLQKNIDENRLYIRKTQFRFNKAYPGAWIRRILNGEATPSSAKEFILDYGYDSVRQNLIAIEGIRFFNFEQLNMRIDSNYRGSGILLTSDVDYSLEKPIYIYTLR